MITTEYLKGSISGEQELHSGNIYPRGENSYLHIKYAENKPSSDEELSDVINNWIGIYADNIPEDSTSYLKYQWHKIKGDIGVQGVPGPEGKSIAEISKVSSDGDINTYRITFTDDTFYDFQITGNTSKIEKVLVNGVELEIVDKVVNIEIDKEIAVSPTQPTTGENVWIKTGKNLFNGILTKGGINSNNGTNNDGLNAIRSDYIKVNNNISYTLSSVDNYNNYIIFYNENYEYIDYYAEGKSVNTFVTPANCSYIRFTTYSSLNVTDITSKFQFEQGSTATDFEEFVEEKIFIKNNSGEFEEYSDIKVSAVRPAQGKVWIKKAKNLFNYKDTNYYNAYINTGKQIWEAANENLGYKSCIVKVEPYTTYTISKTAGQTFRIATYTNYPTLNATYNDTQANHTGTHITFTTGANDNYIVILCFSTANNDIGTYLEMYATVMVEQGSTATTYEAYIEKEIYVKNDNGVFERFYKEKEQNYCIARIGTDYSIQKQYEQENPKGYVGNSATAQLTISDNGIVVGKGVSKVKVSGQLRLNNLSTGDIVFGYISKNNNFPVACSNCSAGDRITFALTETIINVVEGDLIALKTQNNTAARGVVPASTDTTIYSFIKVEVVD